MTFRHLRRFLLLLLPVLMPLSSQAEPYKMSKETYARIGVLPAYDNEGTLPVEESRAYEIEWIDREKARREYYINTFEEQLPLVLATAKTADGKQQLREDMASRRETHDRWEESAALRRKALVAASTYRDPGLPMLSDPNWDELKKAVAPESAPSFSQVR